MNWLSNKLLLSKPLLIFIGQLFYFEPTFFTLEKLFTEGTAFRVFSTTISRNSLYLASFHGFFFLTIGVDLDIFHYVFILWSQRTKHHNLGGKRLHRSRFKMAVVDNNDSSSECSVGE